MKTRRKMKTQRRRPRSPARRERVCAWACVRVLPVVNSNKKNTDLMACVGMLAVTRMRTASQPPETVAFVEELFVLPARRRRTIGRDLLKRAAGTESDRVDRVALVVRRHAPQQAAARGLYAQAGLQFKRRRRLRVARTGEDAAIAPLLARDASTKNEIEGFMEADAESVRTRLWARGTAYLGARERRRFSAMPPKEFLATHRAFMTRIQGCHDPLNGGDGADARAIIKNAELVIVAYEWTLAPMALPYRGK